MPNQPSTPEQQPLVVNIFSVVVQSDGSRSIVTDTTPLCIAFIDSDDPTDPKLGMPGTIFQKYYPTIIRTEPAWPQDMIARGLTRYITYESALEYVQRVAMQGSITLILPQ